MRLQLPIRAGGYLGRLRKQGATAAVAPVLIFALALFLRLYRLDAAPSDVYKDIVIIFDYLNDILAFRWPFYFVDSAGPLYHYLITPVVLVLGMNYLAVKVASVIVSLVTLGAVYIFARELDASKPAALLAVLLGAMSSWFLIFSRLGNSQILTPLLSCLAFYFLARSLKREGGRDLFWATLTAALGLYLYPQTFVLLPAVFVALAWFCWRRQLPWRAMGRFLLWAAIMVLPFILIVIRDPANFLNGYIGGKAAGGSFLGKLSTWPRLVLTSLLMLNVHGDVVFRSNPAQLPHLDVLTGVFFLVGLARLLLARNGRLYFLVLWPFFFLQLPSTFVLNYPGEVPSASRTLLITPFVFLIAALGFEWLAPLVRDPRLRPAVVALACALVLWLNADRYFNRYIGGLPNHNVSFAREIAAAIDQVPPSTQVSVYGCCWGEWSTPETEAIHYSLRRPRPVRFADPHDFVCSQASVVRAPQLIIMAPTDTQLSKRVMACFPNAQIFVANGPYAGPIYRAVRVPGQNIQIASGP